MENNEIFELSDQYLEARNQKQFCEDAQKLASNTVEELEHKLLEKMLNAELDNFKRNGVQFSAVTREFQSANPETKEELYLQFKQRGYEQLFSINANTLGGVVRELKKENEGTLPTWLDGLINEYEKQTIRIKRN